MSKPKPPLDRCPDFARPHLSPLLAELCDLVGLQDTLRMVERWGGTRLWVFDTAAPDSQLVQLLGADKAARVCAAFAGNRLAIPRAARLLRKLRDDDIRDNPDGLTVPQMARRYGLIERRIYQIRGQAPPPDAPPRDERQLDMFSPLTKTPTTNRPRGPHA